MAASLKVLREEAKHCRNCPLYANATQTVFGAGDPHARVMLVGEQPGDEEDRRGLPFVGPAGRLLDRALQAAGVDRGTLYVTNAVKHFKWQPRGKRRLHKTPAQREIEACHPWLEGEIAAIRPEAICCLGATAAKALLGPQFRVSVSRGKLVDSPHAPRVFATLHPSAILRLRDEGEREEAFNALVRDLKLLRPTAPARSAPPPDPARSSAPRSSRRPPSRSGRRAG
jgi:DNA polymerase